MNKWLVMAGIITLVIAFALLIQQSQPVTVSGEISDVRITVLSGAKSLETSILDYIFGRPPRITGIELQSDEPKEVKITYGSNTTIIHIIGNKTIPILPTPQPTPIIVEVDGRRAYIFVGPEGELMGANFEGTLSIGVLSTSAEDYESFKNTVMVYTLAPFVAGTFFTIAGFALGSGSKVKRG